MKRCDHLLWLLAEECVEVAQRVSKAARFGLDEIQPGQFLTNEERIVGELADLQATIDILHDEGMLKTRITLEMNRAKKAKVEKFLAYSKECGTLD